MLKKIIPVIMAIVVIIIIFILSKDKTVKDGTMVIRVAGWDMEYTVSDRTLTIEDFQNMELGSSLEKIEDKLGEPDGWVGSGILSPVYILQDGSAVELIFNDVDRCDNLVGIYLYKDQKEWVLKKMD